MIGQTIAHFHILERLGRGGMGVVYLADDLQLKRKVALKFLPPHLSADEEANQRFMLEAQSASALNHPNVCTIHEIGQTDDGQTFIAMAHYDGETLKKMLEDGPLDVEDAIDIAQQVAEGLARAHDKGIIHRDIKPANIIVTDDGRAVVLDFGLAKLTGAVDLTKPGSTLGTVYYMSPEQARGETSGPEADIWALGVVLYEMVTGRRPFAGEYDQAVVYSILNEEPTPVDSLREDVPPDVARLINRSLAKDPAARPASMHVMLDEIRAVGEPGIAERPEAFVRLKSPWVAVPTLVVVAVTTFLLMRWNEQRAEVEWARQEALPAVARLIDEGNWKNAFKLAQDANNVIPDDSMLLRLWPQMSRFVEIISEPEGARVYRRSHNDTSWQFLGTTPIDSVRHPFGYYFTFRVEKDGYIPTERSMNSGAISDTRFVLAGEGTTPAGMVLVEGGETNVRLPGLDHLKTEVLGDYLLDRFEVTNLQYKAFMDAGGYNRPEYWPDTFVMRGRILPGPEAMALFKDKTGRTGPSTWEVGDFPEGQENHPVAGVSWYEAAAYAAFAGKQLPTLYHWSRAAGTTWSSFIVPFSNFSGKGTTEVGAMKGVGPYGTYDMAGNVREWCLNSSNSGARLILGGGWNDATYSFNDGYAQDPFDRSPTNGIRLIKPVDETADLSSASRSIEIPLRDFRAEKPVSDEVFAIYRNMYRYDRTELNATVEEVDDSDPDWVKERVTFDAAYGGDRMMAYIFVPKNSSPPYQTVVYFPGSGAIHNRSSAGPGPELNAYDYMVKSGRAVVVPIYKGTFERGDELESDYPAETAFYRDHVIMWAKDLSRSLDYLESRPEFDPEKIGYYGVSWGGALGGIMPAVERRIKVVVLYVAGLMVQRALPEADAINYVPRITQPVLMLNGQYDHFFPVETSQKPMFDLLGTPPDQKRQVIYESGHFVPRDQLIRETLEWLDQHLGPVRQ
ncbi:MAG: protein kinase [Rhodothermales bacterium]|nr:protein kinase [Rhodothermales bacterium]